MEMITVTKEVPKDAKEVVDVVVKITKHVMQKKPWAELMLELPAVMGAVDGWENAVAAVKGKKMGETIGYMVGEVAEIFEKEDSPPPAPTAA